MKRISLLCLLVIASITLSSCSINQSKKQVYRIVQENQAFLKECIDEGDYNRLSQIRGIENTTVGKEDSFVECNCGGSGLVPSSSYSGFYYGFYYSPMDIPLVVDVTKTENLSSMDGGWGCKEPNGDKSYYTERIMECWYYFESYF